MSAEIRTVAAAVSLNIETTQRFHTVYKYSDTGFHALQVVAGAPTIANTFSDLPENMPDEEKRNVYWKLRRSKHCGTHAYELLDICVSLNERGVKLVHNNVVVNNFFVLNTCIDVSGLEEKTLSATDYSTGKSFEIGLYSTLANKKALATFPPSICNLMGMQAPSRDDLTFVKYVAKYLKIDPNHIIGHWWCCFVLENETMIHVDLCGPAYNLFQYDLVGEAEVPVYIASSPELFVQEITGGQSGKYAHKLSMTRCCKQGDTRIVPLPSEFLPFQTLDKMSLEITPTDQVLSRSELTGFEALSNANCVVNSIILLSIESNTSNDLIVKVQGIESMPELNGRSFRVIGTNQKGRVIVELSNGLKSQKTERVTMASGKLSFLVEPTLKQWLTLHEMKEALKSTVKVDNLALNPRDVVVIGGLNKAVSLNGKQAVIIEQADTSGTRWIVELEGSKKRKSIAGKNLKLINKYVPDCDEVLLRKKIEKILINDPEGQKFHRRVFSAMNVGLTNLTDPELLPVFRRLVKLKVGKVLLNNPPQQRQWEVIVQLSNNAAFSGFRELLIRLRSGTSPELWEKGFNENPAYKTMYNICVKQGILKARSVQI